MRAANFHFLSRALALASLTLGLSASALADWKIVKIEGRDYVPLESVASFYALPQTVPPFSQMTPVALGSTRNRRMELEGPRKSIEVITNSREITLNGAKHWLAFPTLVKDEQVLISRLDLSKTIDPALRPQSVKNLTPLKTIVLDPGHGGHDNGALSIFGKEKNFALDICRRLKTDLEARDFRVVLTRNTDTFIPLPQRPQLANRYDDAILVSVHLNSSSQNRLASGFEIFSVTPRGAPSTNEERLTQRDLQNAPGNAHDAQNSVLANTIFHSLIGQVPQPDRGIKHARFAVLRLARIPAVLVECGFLSNNDEASLIGQASWRAKVAGAIADGIVNYQQLSTTGEAPQIVADYRKQIPSGVELRPESTVLTEKKAE